MGRRLMRWLHWFSDRHHSDPHPFDEDLYDHGKGWPKQLKLF